MKKSRFTLVAAFLALSASATLVACNKDSQEIKPATTLTHSTTIDMYETANRSNSVQPFVSSKGYLIFSDPTMVADFVNDISTLTFSNLQSLSNDMGFQCMQNATLSGNGLVGENEIQALLLNHDGIIEIAGTLFKFSSSSPAFLTSQHS